MLWKIWTYFNFQQDELWMTLLTKLLNDEVLQWKMGRMLVLMAFLHCLWVWKERTDTGEADYRLWNGPWRHKPVRFGVSQGAEMLRFQLNDEVLRRKLGRMLVLMAFLHCLWVWKERTDRSEESLVCIHILTDWVSLIYSSFFLLVTQLTYAISWLTDLFIFIIRLWAWISFRSSDPFSPVFHVTLPSFAVPHHSFAFHEILRSIRPTNLNQLQRTEQRENRGSLAW